MNSTELMSATVPVVRAALLALARAEDDRAAAEAAAVPYWAPCPESVHGHRLAADALRAAADSYLQAS